MAKVKETSKEASLATKEMIQNHMNEEYLGFLIKDGAYILLNRNKLSGISCPTNINELQKVLGLLNWFSDFIPNFASIIKPLSDNLSNFNTENVKSHFYECIKKLELYPCAAFNFVEQFILVSDASEFSGCWCPLSNSERGKVI
ncbi:hypothetical protein H8356DRAFT_1083508 [Neocallimastix lanati (nom. inval.)]|nr:hypothetical protein H8356DRAFT_1083508 [Neocallimastix sp. JGI-2020a]